ncbi:MAG: hypothetical protein AB2A00_02925 [Myxococcota bacterium]
MKLATRLGLTSVAAVLMAVGGSLGALAWSASREVGQTLRLELDRSRRGWERVLGQEAVVLQASGRALAVSSLLQSALTSKAVDDATLMGITQERRETMQLDLLALLTSEGAVRAASPERGVSLSLPGDTLGSDRVWPVLLDGVLHLVVSLPVEHGPRVAGYVVVGRRVDDAFLAAVAAELSAALVVRQGERILARSSNDGDDAALLAAECTAGVGLEVAGRAHLGTCAAFNDLQVLLLRDEVQARGVYHEHLRRLLLVGLVAFVLSALVSMLMGRRLAQRITSVTHAVTCVARGNLAEARAQDRELRALAAGSREDELSMLAGAYVDMNESLRGMVADLQDTAAAIEQHCRNLQGTAVHQFNLASQQAAVLRDATQTMQELSRASAQARDNAERILRDLSRSRHNEALLQSGMSGVQETMAAITSLGQQLGNISGRMVQVGDKVGSLVEAVRGFAEHSRRLALRAQVDNAGQQRLVDKVAAEIRELAVTSQATVGNADGVMSEARRSVHEAAITTAAATRRAETSIQRARTASENIQELAGVLRQNTLAIKRISEESRQQSEGIRRIAVSFEEMDRNMGAVVKGAHVMESASAAFRQLSARLNALARRYEL